MAASNKYAKIRFEYNSNVIINLGLKWWRIKNSHFIINEFSVNNVIKLKRKKNKFVVVEFKKFQCRKLHNPPKSFIFPKPRRKVINMRQHAINLSFSDEMEKRASAIVQIKINRPDGSKVQEIQWVALPSTEENEKNSLKSHSVPNKEDLIAFVVTHSFIVIPYEL